MARDGVDAAKSSYEAALFARANVVGVAVGNKVIGGRDTEERCVVVFVERKRPEDQLRRRDIVPRDLGGVHTDVVETGRFLITAGTLGVTAHRRGRPVILSNNHVLANANDGRPGDLILQPGPADGGRTQDAIGRLTDFVPIQFRERRLGALGRLLERALGPALAAAGLGLKRLPSGRANLIDAAIAEPISADVVAPEILGIGRVSGTVDASIGMRIRK